MLLASRLWVVDVVEAIVKRVTCQNKRKLSLISVSSFWSVLLCSTLGCQFRVLNERSKVLPYLGLESCLVLFPEVPVFYRRRCFGCRLLVLVTNMSATSRAALLFNGISIEKYSLK